MRWYSIEPRTRKYFKGYGILWFLRHLSNKYKKQLLDTWLDTQKSASKKVVNKADKATGEFLGNKIAKKKNVKPKHLIDENPRNAENIISPPKKGEEILNELRKVS